MNKNKPGIMHGLLADLEESDIILGDLKEVFHYKLRSENKTRVLIWYIGQIMWIVMAALFIRLHWAIIMLKNYISLSLRMIKRTKMNSLINLTGLAVGMAVFLLIMLWIQDELSFDKFHENNENIYRVISEQNNSGNMHKSVGTPNTLGEKLFNEYPEIIDYTLYGAIRYHVPLGIDDEVYPENVGACASPSFFNIFTFNFIHGTPETALSSPNSIVLTEDLSAKIYAGENPMGKSLEIFGRSVTVTAVIENVPHNSHMQFDHIVDRLFWGNSAIVRTYLLLEDGTDPRVVSNKIAGALNETQDRNNVKLDLQLLSRIHLYSKKFSDDIYNANIGDITYVYIFALSALCVLIIACINFVNLSSALFSKRIKEIGLRKVIGAKKTDIIQQFYGESVLFSYASFAIALFIVYLLLPEFNQLSSKQLEFAVLTGHNLFPLLIFLPLMIGLVSGSYPALLLSSVQPANAFKDTAFFKKNSSHLIRRVLVITQFVFTNTIIILTIISFSQLSFMQNKDLGFDRDKVVGFSMHSYKYAPETIRNEFLKNPNIQYVSIGFPPVSHFTGITDVTWEGKREEDQVTLYYVYVDHDFLNVLGLEMSDGRFFSNKFPADSVNYVINETAARVMGLDSPVGTKFQWNYRDRQEGTIIGVVQDYNHESLHHEIKPAMYFMAPWYPYILARVSPENVHETVAYIETVWEKFQETDVPFRYNILNEAIDSLYSSEKRTGLILKYFTGLIVMVSCLGLFGLASITAIQRKREIAVRKVLGASVTNVNFMLIKDFMRMILISTIISWPVAFYIAQKWLEGFAYRISVNPVPFAFAGLLAISISLLSVVFQVVKAANSNLVDSIRFD